MIAEDKEGSPIYHKTFAKMQTYARILVKRGNYIESRAKPNLFYKKEDSLIYFADMRGVSEEPIWIDPRPVFYWRSANGVPNWQVNRQIKKEIDKFQFLSPISKISASESSKGLGGEVDKSDEDGYCKLCGKDFRDNGYYCSHECEWKAQRALIERVVPRCSTCNRLIVVTNNEMKYFTDSEATVSEVIRHHISYKDGKTVTVCASCHQKIHKSNDFPELKPIDARPKGRKLKRRKCARCGTEFQPKNNAQSYCSEECKRKTLLELKLQKDIHPNVAHSNLTENQKLELARNAKRNPYRHQTGSLKKYSPGGYARFCRAKYNLYRFKKCLD